jgi:hypothetical protein
VLGERRFALRALLEENTAYLVGAVDEFDDRPGTAPLPQERAQLLELAEEYRGALTTLSDAAGDPPDWAAESEAFTFQVAALVELELEVKLELQAERSTRERTRDLIRHLPPLLQLLRGRAEVHVRARSNGKGGHDHDITTDG